MRHAIQVSGSLRVKILQLFGFDRIQPAVRAALERGEKHLEFAPARPGLCLKSLEIENHSRCSRLLSKYPSTAVRRNILAGTNRSRTSNWRSCRASAPRR